VENVKVTLHLSAEAAKILYDYAGDRNRGYFISQLLIAQRRADDAEGKRVAEEAKRVRAARAREKYTLPR